LTQETWKDFVPDNRGPHEKRLFQVVCRRGKSRQGGVWHAFIVQNRGGREEVCPRPDRERCEGQSTRKRRNQVDTCGPLGRGETERRGQRLPIGPREQKTVEVKKVGGDKGDGSSI